MAYQVKLGGRSLKRLREVINGDSRDGVEIVSRYRSGPDLISLFNEFGQNDLYGDGFPSRWLYTDACLREINNTKELSNLIETVLDPLEFADADDLKASVEYLNPAFARDGWRLVLDRDRIKLRPSVPGPDFEPESLQPYSPASQEFVDEHFQKCREKLEAEDYSGAITNARSLLEAVLFDVLQRLEPSDRKADGDLPKLQKQVNKLLREARGADPNAVSQFVRGLEGVVSGIAGTSNVMGDRHSGSGMRAERRHARLAVHCAYALCDFYVEAVEALPSGNSPSR